MSRNKTDLKSTDSKSGFEVGTIKRVNNAVADRMVRSGRWEKVQDQPYKMVNTEEKQYGR